MGLDCKTTEAFLSSGLPSRARWMVEGEPLDFEFTVGRCGLYRLSEGVVADTGTAACDLLVFGEQDYAEGGGSRSWLCVRERDGAVYGFDPELEEPLVLLNSSVPRFVATFQTLDGYLSKDAALPPDCHGRLRGIDPEAYQDSDWRLLVECLPQRASAEGE